MTGPLAAGGQPFTLAIGGPSQMLTEYAGGPNAPLWIINTSGDLAWVAGHSGVGPSNGVPLEPGTALPWTASGQAWAVADTGAAAPVTLTITSAIAGWSPSPYAIAAAVATKLLASGVTIKAQLTTILSNVNVAGIGGTAAFDISGYASLLVAVQGTSGLIVQQYDSAGSIVATQYVAPGPNQGGSTPVGKPLAAIGITAKVFAPGTAAGAQVWVAGSTRPALANIDGRQNDAAGDEWSLPSTTWTPGTQVLLAQTSQSVSAQFGVQLHGLVDVTLAMSVAASQGAFFLQYTQLDAARSAGITTVQQEIADDTMFSAPAAGSMIFKGQIAIPAGPYAVYFTPRTAGPFAVSARMVPAAV